VSWECQIVMKRKYAVYLLIRMQLYYEEDLEGLMRFLVCSHCQEKERNNCTST